MTIESVAGKNPITHTGKLYNAVAGRIAAAVLDIAGVHDAECLVLSEIGRSIVDPYLVDVRLGCTRWAPHLVESVTGIVRHKLDHPAALRDEFLQGHLYRLGPRLSSTSVRFQGSRVHVMLCSEVSGSHALDHARMARAFRRA